MGKQFERTIRGVCRPVPGHSHPTAPTHKGPALRAFLRRNPRLSVEYLPPYAPELNPAEAAVAISAWYEGEGDSESVFRAAYACERCVTGARPGTPVRRAGAD